MFMLRALTIFVVCIGVIGALFLLPTPTYDTVRSAFDGVSNSSAVIMDDFNSISLIGTVVSDRFALDPDIDGMELRKSTDLDGNPALAYSYFRYTYDLEGNPVDITVLNSSYVTFSNKYSRDKVYGVMSFLFGVPVFDVGGLFGTALNSISSVLFVIAMILAFVAIFVFLIIDVFGVALSVLIAFMKVVGFIPVTA